MKTLNCLFLKQMQQLWIVLKTLTTSPFLRTLSLVILLQNINMSTWMQYNHINYQYADQWFTQSIFYRIFMFMKMVIWINLVVSKGFLQKYSLLSLLWKLYRTLIKVLLFIHESFLGVFSLALSNVCLVCD